MADAAATKKLPIGSDLAAGPSLQEQVDAKLAEARLKKQRGALNAKARLGAGATRQRFRHIQEEQEADERALKEVNNSRDAEVSTERASSANNDISYNIDYISRIVERQPLDICSEVVQALATGDAVIIPASHMPVAKIPEEARQPLAELWAEDIRRLEAQLPLRGQEVASPIATPPQQQAGTSILPTSQSGPPLPSRAPELYRDGKRDPATGRRLEFVDEFIERVYAPWIVDSVLTFGRDGLKGLDPECETAAAQWLNNHGGNTLFGMERRSKAVEPPTPEQVREARRVLKWVERHKKTEPDGLHNFASRPTIER